VSAPANRVKNIFDQIPGYRAAVEAEAFTRDLAFAEVPEDVAGVAVGPLNWLRFVRLAVMGSPIVCGGRVTPADVAAALWLLSVDYHPQARLRRWRFLRRLRSQKFLALASALDAYVQEALADAPGGSGELTGPRAFSGVAAYVDLFASEYGWPPADVLRLPFKQLFQLHRCIEARKGRNVFFNPSDKVRGEWLRQQNCGGGVPPPDQTHN